MYGRSHPLRQSSVSLLRDDSVVGNRRNTPPALKDNTEPNPLSGILQTFSQTDVAGILTFLQQ